MSDNVDIWIDGINWHNKCLPAKILLWLCGQKSVKTIPLINTFKLLHIKFNWLKLSVINLATQKRLASEIRDLKRDISVGIGNTSIEFSESKFAFVCDLGQVGWGNK